MQSAGPADSNTNASRPETSNVSFQQFDYPLPLNKDGSLSFYWFDAHEENNGQDLYIFGKIYQPEVKAYVSCALKINGM